MLKTFTFRRNDGTTFTVQARDTAQAMVKAQVQHDQTEADKRQAVINSLLKQA